MFFIIQILNGMLLVSDNESMFHIYHLAYFIISFVSRRFLWTLIDIGLQKAFLVHSVVFATIKAINTTEPHPAPRFRGIKHRLDRSCVSSMPDAGQRCM